MEQGECTRARVRERERERERARDSARERAREVHAVHARAPRKEKMNERTSALKKGEIKTEIKREGRGDICAGVMHDRYGMRSKTWRHGRAQDMQA